MKWVSSRLLVATLSLAANQLHSAVAEPCQREPSEASDASQRTSSESEVQAQGPLRREDQVVVTASRSPGTVGDSVSLVTVIDAGEIRNASSLVLDDALRQVPGFSLFRRNSSLTAHPTTQGLSLRGIGPSGAGRSLVLLDGVPLNDPFGGWVYWNRVPISALGRIEVVRGATSHLYGSSALGGVVQLVTREAEPPSSSLSASGGSFSTFDLEGSHSENAGNWSYLAAGRLFDTDGFVALDESILGRVDRPVDVSFGTFLARASHGGFRVGVNAYSEGRGNGTVLQTNASDLFQVDAGYRGRNWRIDGYLQGGVLESQFSRVLPDRSAEFPTAFQRIESSALGASALWQPRGSWLVGGDWRQVAWEEEAQHLLGFFAQTGVPLTSRLDLQLGGRIDLWENREFQGSFSPKAGVVYRAAEPLALRASAYRGFRAPTLNELYRPFRVGNISTLANPDLGAESLWGGEAGVDFFPSGSSVVRVNAFWNRLEDPVGNATISVSEQLILRQRQNIGRATVRGSEVEALWQVASTWSLEAAYLYSSSEVSETGLWIPQVPRHQASAAVRNAGSLIWTLQGRAVSGAFEDDLNLFGMGGFGLVDLFVARRLPRGLELFLAAQNLFDKRFATGRVPEERLGEPRLIRGGLRILISH